MQSGAADRTAGQLDRLQHRRRGQHPGTPYLDHNVQELGLGLLGRILVGNGPAGIFARGAQNSLLPDVVHLGYRAVGIVSQGRPAGAVLGNKFVNAGFVRGDGPVLRSFKPVAGQHLQGFGMFFLSAVAYAVGKKA